MKLISKIFGTFHMDARVWYEKQ